MRWADGDSEFHALKAAKKAKPVELDCERFELAAHTSWDGRVALVYTDSKGRVLISEPQGSRDFKPKSALSHLVEQLTRGKAKPKSESPPSEPKSESKNEPAKK